MILRALVKDHAEQAEIAERELLQADTVIVTLPVFCELVWVLRSAYRFSAVEVAAMLRKLVETESIESDRPAVSLGIKSLEAGGDFADAVIAYEGRLRGAQEFVSFDREAVKILTSLAVPSRPLV